MAAQFARGREFSEQDLFFTGASNAISLGVNSFVDSSITRGLVTDALDNGLQMAIYSTKSFDWGVMLAHAGGAYLGNKMHDGIAQQHAARYSELHSYNVNTDAFLNSYTGSDLTIGGLMSRLDAERPLSLGFGGAREEVAANDSSFSSALTRIYNNQLNSPGIMGSVARFDRGFGSALREGMASAASSFLHPLDTLSSSLLFATDIADIPLELLGVMFSSDAKARNLQRLDGVLSVGGGLISGDATQSGHAAGQLSSLVFSAYGVKMGGALSVDVLEQSGVKSALRARVEKNIFDSRQIRETSGFLAFEAKVDQINIGYFPDRWKMGWLHKGDIVYGGLPGQSSYYTSLRTVISSKGLKDILYKSLQVAENKIRGYRSDIGIYQIIDDIKIPMGIVENNLEYGFGGGDQYLIKAYNKKLIKIDQLKLSEFYESRVQKNKVSP